MEEVTVVVGLVVSSGQLTEEAKKNATSILLTDTDNEKNDQRITYGSCKIQSSRMKTNQTHAHTKQNKQCLHKRSKPSEL